MISEKSAELAVGLAAIATKAGVSIAPMADTPVASITAVALQNFNGELYLPTEDGNNASEEDDQKFRAVMVSNICGQSHTAHIDAIIDDVAKAVANHISFAKNVVTPAVKELAEYVLKGVSAVIDPFEGFDIHQRNIPAPLTVKSFETALRSKAGNYIGEPRSYARLPAKTTEEIKELLVTGSRELDNAVSGWVTSELEHHPEFLIDVWTNLFSQDSNAAPVKDNYTFTAGITNRAWGQDVAIVTYLLAAKMREEVPANTRQSLDSWQQCMDDYIEVAANRLVQEIDLLDSAVKSGQLVFDRRVDNKQLTVFAPVYTQWLKDGGSADVLLGMLMSTQKNTHIGLINELKSQYLDSWNRFSVVSTSRAANQVFTRFQEQLSLGFAAGMRTSYPEEEEMQRNPDHLGTVSRLFDEQLKEITNADTENVYNTCMKLVCRSRFYYTDAEKILVGIESAMKANSKLTVDEAALVSITEYVSDYVADQLQLV